METQYISLNMTPTGVNPCFHISQYDIGRSLGFMIYNGAEVVDLDSYTCTIEATRSDGVAITVSVTTDDNIGTFETTATMTNKADKYKAQFVIVDGDSNRIASLPFDMDVCKAAMDENSESIEEDASLYQQYTETVQGAIAEANADIQAEENARIAAVSNEATTRANADTTLQNNITAEATARQTADNTLQDNINSEASTRASADSNLQSQINQIIAPSGEAPSAAEVQNARIGADGATYDTLGDAIRGQVSDLKSAIKMNAIGDNVNSFEIKPHFSSNAGSSTQGIATIFTTGIPLTLTAPQGYVIATAQYDAENNLLFSDGWIASSTVRPAVYKVDIRIKKSAGGTIYPSDYISINSNFEIAVTKGLAPLLHKMIFTNEEFYPSIVRLSSTRATCTIVNAFTPVKVELSDTNYQFALYENGLNGNEMVSVSTGWVSAFYLSKNAFSGYMVFRKADNGNLTDGDIYALNSALNIERIYELSEAYVATNGSDETGNGTSEAPFATIRKALSQSNNIKLFSGNYTESIVIKNRSNLSISSAQKTADTDTVTITASGTRVLDADNIDGLKLDDIMFSGANSYVAYIQNSRNVLVQNCKFTNSSSQSGLGFYRSDGIVYSCEASGNYNDGFNIHGHGCVDFINCTGKNNGGDGLSHHDKCTGSVIGGYWTGNTKGGISTPTYGAVVNISDAICEGNGYGMQIFGGDEVTENTVHIKVTNVVFKDNTIAGLQLDKYIADLVNCVFTGNTADTDIVSGTVNTYDSGN